MFVDIGPLPFVNFSAPGTSEGSYLASPLHPQSTLWGVPPQASIWNGKLSVKGDCVSESQTHPSGLPAYFLLQPATYNNTANITYALFFVLASYNSSLLNSFNPGTYSEDDDAINNLYPTNDIYITSAIQWQPAHENIDTMSKNGTSA